MSKHITQPGENDIKHAADIIKAGGVVVFPTWCLYGLGADIHNPEAVNRIFDIKQRPADNPLLMLIHSRDTLDKIVREIPVSASKLMDNLWPGRVTIVFNALDSIPDTLTAGTGKIGIRIPEHPVALSLVRELKSPITGTSANISGQPGCSSIDRMPSEITDKADLIIDSGPLKGGIGSTVVDVTCEPIRIIREGEVSKAEIFNAIY